MSDHAEEPLVGEGTEGKPESGAAGASGPESGTGAPAADCDASLGCKVFGVSMLLEDVVAAGALLFQLVLSAF